MSTGTIKYSCPSVCLSVCVWVCVCVCVHDNSKNNGSIHLKLEHVVVVYENSSDEFDIVKYRRGYFFEHGCYISADKVRQTSIAYSKNKAKQFREKMKNLENEVSLLEQNLFCNYDQYQLKKKQLEECYDKVTEGILIRSRVQCYEYGEKSTKYFLSQEQKNKRKSNIRKILLENGMEVTNPDEILNELKDYFHKKSCDERKVSENDCDEFKRY